MRARGAPSGTLRNMSRGIGATQRAILDALDGATDRWWLTVAGLAESVDRSQRQVRAAVRSLEHRGLVAITREAVDWDSDRGEHGMPIHGLAVWLPERRREYVEYWQRMLGVRRGA